MNDNDDKPRSGRGRGSFGNRFGAWKRHRYLSAGLLDAGFASLAGFAAGLTAVRVLDAASLGTYALVFSAFNLVAVIPQQLLFGPFEIVSVGYPRERRLTIFRESMRLGGALALFASLLLALWVIVAPPGTPSDGLLALTVTGIACSFLSPVQDHLRRMQHLAGRPAAAAAVSAVHLTATMATIGALLWFEVPGWWIPLGSLSVANLVSTGFGLLISARWLRMERPPGVLDVTGMLHSGKWLLIPGLAAPAGAFLVGVLIAHLAGAAALGYVEAARIVGMPMFVLAMGLSASLGPRSMEAAREHRAHRARQISRRFFSFTMGTAVIYLVLFGFPWSWNPLLQLVPRAFDVAWLVPAVLISITLNGALLPVRSEILGAQRQKSMAFVDSAATLVRIIAGGTAAVTGSFAMPIGYVVLGAIRWTLYRRILRNHYGTRPDTPAVAEPRVPSDTNPVAV